MPRLVQWRDFHSHSRAAELHRLACEEARRAGRKPPKLTRKGPTHQRTFPTERQAKDYAAVLKTTTPPGTERVVSIAGYIPDEAFLQPEQLELAGDEVWPIQCKPEP